MALANGSNNPYKKEWSDELVDENDENEVSYYYIVTKRC